MSMVSEGVGIRANGVSAHLDVGEEVVMVYGMKSRRRSFTR